MKIVVNHKIMAIEAQFPSWVSQDLMLLDSSGCGGVNGGGAGNGFNHFYFNPQHQQQIQLQNQQLQNSQPRNENLCCDNPLKQSNNNYISSGNQYQSMSVSQDQKQRLEIDHYIRLQNERFRLLLQEQRRQQTVLLLKRIESKAMPLFRQKDEQISEAAKRRTELENFFKRLEIESEAWQRVAQENEAMVVSLNNTIKQLRENATSCSNNYNNGGDDAESCCEIGRTELEDDEEEKMMAMPCKRCRSRNSCVLFLPCRHLCSCKDCEAFLDTCPVCQTGKKASIEAIIMV